MAACKTRERESLIREEEVKIEMDLLAKEKQTTNEPDEWIDYDIKMLTLLLDITPRSFLGNAHINACLLSWSYELRFSYENILFSCWYPEHLSCCLTSFVVLCSTVIYQQRFFITLCFSYIFPLFMVTFVPPKKGFISKGFLYHRYPYKNLFI